MTQQYLSQISDPSAESGPDLAARLNAFDTAHKTNQAGVTRPTGIAAGGLWTKNNGDGTYTLMLFDGAADKAMATAASPIFTGAPDFSGVSNAATILSDLGAAPINNPTFTGTVGGVPGRLIGQWIRGSAGAYTYTPTAGTKYIWVRIAGGGGGGAGVGSGGSTYSARVGGGGGAGGYCEFFAEVTFSSYSARVAPGGAGGSSNGSSSQSSWIFPSEVDKPSLWVEVNGGLGGETTNGSVGVVGPGGNGGGYANIGGTDLVWSYFQEGGTGGHGTASPRNGESSGGYAMGGFGGFTPLGELENGPTVYASSSQAGGADGNRGGCGGAGACSLHSGGSATGGDGAPGAIIIFEFSE